MITNANCLSSRTTKLCDRPAAVMERNKIYEKIQDSERKAEGRFTAARG